MSEPVFLENKKNISKRRLLEFLPSMLRINAVYWKTNIGIVSKWLQIKNNKKQKIHLYLFLPINSVLIIHKVFVLISCRLV